MKKLLIISTILLASFAYNQVQAQVSVNVNIGQQPKWGPRGYNHVDYYYMPDIQAYYYVPTRMYTYMINGRWITTRNLPPAYRNYDLYRGNYVVVNEPRPWLRHNYYMSRYHGRGYRDVRNDRRDDRRDNHYNDRNDHNNGGHDHQDRGHDRH